jgi:RNA polymerase sigma factor (sigma-70 family)
MTTGVILNHFVATFYQLGGLIYDVNHKTGNNPEDKQLIDRVLRDDTRAFGIVIKNTEKLVAQIVFKLIPIPEDRKDLAQDIYLKVYHRLAGFKFQSKLSTWIAQIAYNTCLSWIEKKKPLYPGDFYEENFQEKSSLAEYNRTGLSNDAEIQLSQKELGLILRKEIENLPAMYQMLITLFHQESMTYEELSQVTGLPSGTVKSYLFRARKTLKENLLTKYKKEAL